MSTIDIRLARLQRRLADEREQAEAHRVRCLIEAEQAFQLKNAQILQRRKNMWDKMWRRCRRKGWPIPPLSERPVSDVDEINWQRALDAS